MAVGDVCFGQKMEAFSTKYPNKVFDGIRTLAESVDLTVANLEGPLSNRGQSIPGKKTVLLTGRVSHVVHMRGNPAAASILANAGFNLVSLANNHILDYGPIAVADTLDHLAAAGVIALGAAKDGCNPSQPVTVETKGLSVNFLAFSAFAESRTQSGISIAQLTPNVVLPAVELARRQADAVVVSFHWGMEGKEFPFWKDVELARAAIDAGAILVIGHHPHFLQGIERYRNGLIAYSLGNCLFDPDYAAGKGSETIALVCELGAQGMVSWELYPLMLNKDGCPVIASDNDGQRIRIGIQDISAPLQNPNDPIWAKNLNLDLNNQASWLWARGWRVNLGRILNVRPRHFLVLWQLLRLVWGKYVRKNEN
jgi:poly-gamma-glutamate synthesis protein (capsule biosynthesis protein)